MTLGEQVVSKIMVRLFTDPETIGIADTLVIAFGNDMCISNPNGLPWSHDISSLNFDAPLACRGS